MYSKALHGTATIVGSTKRGVGLAMQIGFGNLGGAVVGFTYQQEDAPHHRAGHGTLIATLCMNCGLAIFMTWYLRRENERRDREYKAPSEYILAEMELEADKGDDATFFRCTI
ncbi:hypothetical protein QQZ08_006891 [Neonectria magnoliae]|uniref:Uncharacterized protein n=1 Tax=Neonectria magnoliae TaxID=2732573 RepID=A0ABR1HZR3_9HYPO